MAVPSGPLPASKTAVKDSGLGLHALGLVPSSYRPELYRGQRADLSRLPTQEALLQSVDLSGDLPPVGDQGSQGACVAFSVGYYYKTFQEWREYGWDVSAPEHQFSPSFLYNQVAPLNEGMTFDEAFNTFLDKGCATLPDCPFVESDYRTWPSYTAFLNGIPHRIQSYTRLGNGQTAGILDAMKAQLATGGSQGAGDLCVIGIPIYRPSSSLPGRFDLLTPTDYFYDGPASEDTYLAGYHAIAVVGYDDAAFDGRGGFKIVNSWGSGWGNQGYAYISYQFVQTWATDVYIMEDRIGYQRTAIAHFKLYHPYWWWNSDNVTVSIGVGPTSAPLWSKVFLTGLERSALTVDMAVDISEGSAYLPPSWNNQWWVKIADHHEEDVAELTIFEVEYDSILSSAEAVMPLYGGFFGGDLFAYLPAGEKASGNYYVSATGDDTNDGLAPATAKRSVQAIIDRYTLKAGDVVWIGPGTYNLTSDIKLTQLDRGEASGPVRFVGTSLNGELATVLERGGSGRCFNLLEGSRFVQLENLELRGGANGVYYDGAWAFGSDGSDGLCIKNSNIHRANGTGISLMEVDGVYLENCQVWDCGRLHWYFDSDAIKVRCSSVELVNCTIAGAIGSPRQNSLACVHLVPSDSYYSGPTVLILRGSILQATGPNSKCVEVSWATVSSARYNDLFATNGATIGFTPDGTNISADPLFADQANGDYRLTALSPCLDAGTNTGGPSTDIEGCIRPQDGNGDGLARCDMGAYEYPLNLFAAKSTYPDGNEIAFGGVSVSGRFPADGRIYVERANRSSGIRVDTAGDFAEGEVLNVSGTIQTDSLTGERYVSAVAPWPKLMGGSSMPGALALPNRALGGGASGLQPGVLNGFGLNNIGLLVNAWGRVTQVGEDYLYIDDGSKLKDGTLTGAEENIGVRVICDPTDYDAGDYLIVTGISSCFETPSAQIARRILVRRPSDIRKI